MGGVDGRGGGNPEGLLLAGIDVDRGAAAIRVGDLKLLVGSWGADVV